MRLSRWAPPGRVAVTAQGKPEGLPGKAHSSKRRGLSEASSSSPPRPSSHFPQSGRGARSPSSRSLAGKGTRSHRIVWEGGETLRPLRGRGRRAGEERRAERRGRKAKERRGGQRWRAIDSGAQARRPEPVGADKGRGGGRGSEQGRGARPPGPPSAAPGTGWSRPPRGAPTSQLHGPCGERRAAGPGRRQAGRERRVCGTQSARCWRSSPPRGRKFSLGDPCPIRASPSILSGAGPPSLRTQPQPSGPAAESCGSELALLPRPRRSFPPCAPRTVRSLRSWRALGSWGWRQVQGWAGPTDGSPEAEFSPSAGRRLPLPSPSRHFPFEVSGPPRSLEFASFSAEPGAPTRQVPRRLPPTGARRLERLCARSAAAQGAPGQPSGPAGGLRGRPKAPGLRGHKPVLPAGRGVSTPCQVHRYFGSKRPPWLAEAGVWKQNHVARLLLRDWTTDRLVIPWAVPGLCFLSSPRD